MIPHPTGEGSGHSTYWGRTFTTAGQTARSAPAIYLRASRSHRLWNCRLGLERNGSTVALGARCSEDGGRAPSTRSAVVLHLGLRTILMDSAMAQACCRIVP